MAQSTFPQNEGGFQYTREYSTLLAVLCNTTTRRQLLEVQIKVASINLSHKKIKRKLSKCSYLHTRVPEAAAAAVMQPKEASRDGLYVLASFEDFEELVCLLGRNPKSKFSH